MLFWCQANVSAACSLFEVNGTNGIVNVQTALSYSGATTTVSGWGLDTDNYNGRIFASYNLGTIRYIWAINSTSYAILGTYSFTDLTNTDGVI